MKVPPATISSQSWSRSDSEQDRSATQFADLIGYRLFLDGVLRGEIASELIERTSNVTDWSFVQDGDLATAAAPIDFLGVNYYRPHLIAGSGDVKGAEPYPCAQGAWVVPQSGPKTAMDWLVDPESMTEIGRPVPVSPELRLWTATRASGIAWSCGVISASICTLVRARSSFSIAMTRESPSEMRW